jgi:hypothetical protein
MSYEEHDLLHSKFAQSSVDYPHSFLWRAVHEDSSDYNSNIVGMVGAAFAWDESLLNLLPDGVSGLHVHISNGDCNQSYTYTIRGPDAIYISEDDTENHDNDLHQGENRHNHNDHHHEHESIDRYERMAVRVSLSPHTHPDYPTTPGHCQYEMVSNPKDKRMYRSHPIAALTHVSLHSLLFRPSTHRPSSKAPTILKRPKRLLQWWR